MSSLSSAWQNLELSLKQIHGGHDRRYSRPSNKHGPFPSRHQCPLSAPSQQCWWPWRSLSKSLWAHSHLTALIPLTTPKAVSQHLYPCTHTLHKSTCTYQNFVRLYLKYFYLSYVYMYVLVCRCVLVPVEANGIRSPWSRSCRWLSVPWELNLGSLLKQYMLSTPELSLWLIKLYY